MSATYDIYCDRAENLLVKDFRTSDPYLKFYLKNVGESSVQKSNVIQSNLNPVWDQHLIIQSDPSDTLVVEMYDSDKGSNDDAMMNPIEIPLNTVTAEAPYDFNQDLQYKEKAAGHLHFTVSLRTPAAGEATPAAQAAEPTEVFFDIHAVKATNLIKADADASDPYLVFYLKSLGKDAALKTKEIKNDLNPVWDQHFQLSTNNLSDSIVVELWDKDISKDDRLMNDLEYPVSSITPETPLNFDQDIQLNEKPAGHLEFHISCIAPQQVQSRDIEITPGQQCHFQWGEDGSTFSTSFSGYSECSKTLDDILKGQDFDHVHAVITPDVEPKPAKPKKVEEVTGTLVSCENLGHQQEDNLDFYATVQLIGRSAIGKGKGTLVTTEHANTPSPTFNKEFKLEKGKIGDAVLVVVYQQSSTNGLLRVGYARIPIHDVTQGPNEPQDYPLLRPRKFNGENALEEKLESYGTVKLSLNRTETFVEPSAPAPQAAEQQPAGEQQPPQ